MVLSKNQSPQQSAQMRAFIRQMQQKLRRTPAKTDKQLADSLERIASEQKSLASELEQSPSQGVAPESTLAGVTGTGADSTTNTDAIVQSGNSGNTENVEESADSLGNSQKKTQEVKPETREQDLVERVRAIETGLSQAVKRSSLVIKRMEDSIKAMDELTGKLREAANGDSIASANNDTTSTDATPNVDPMAAPSAEAAIAYEISDHLRELATHIGALSQTEPANRISSLRDMTSALSNMEHEVSSSMSKAAELREPTKTGAALSSTGSTESEAAVDAKLAQARKTVERLGLRLGDRASTVEDVLKTAPDLGSLEANEINDRVQKFVSDNEFLDDLTNSRTAMEKPTGAKETDDWAQAAGSRATEYADAAMQLDSMYRQLVMPRTDQLRKLEAVANQLNKALSQQNGGSGKTTEPQSKGKGGSVESLKRELQNGLKEAELDDLLEMLAGSGEQEQESQTGANGTDPAFQDSNNSATSSKQFSVKNDPLVSGVARIQRELRSRIQELIMLEIADDRDAPVPTQYRELIDGYFRTIAGGVDAVQENLQ